jgi:hypothetical protein
LRDGPGLHQVREVAQHGRDGLVVGHEHVHARVEALAKAILIRQPELEAGVEVGDHEAAEAELALQHVGDHGLVDVHLGALPAAVGSHDRADSGRDRSAIGRQVDGTQGGLVARDRAAVHAARRAAVAEVVLGVGQGCRWGPRRGELQPLDHDRAHGRGQVGGLAKGS